MNSKLSVYIFPFSAVFNTEAVPVFDKMTPEESQALYSTLYMNYKEILESMPSEPESYFCLCEEDRDFIPEELNSENINIKFYNRQECWDALNSIIEKKLQSTTSNVIILLGNSIGISPNDIKKISDYLDNDDNTIVLGRTSDDTLCFIGMNNYRTPFFIGESFDNIAFDRVLRKINCDENYIFQMDGFLAIESFDNFRHLYKLLSTKESIAFCSHAKHELFTNLFIEYKEFL
jgi:CO dehydrogenase/acetyl-CoA synthase epsilon subunit